MSKNIKTIPTSEYDAIARVIDEYYVESGRTGDKSLLEQAFHNDAVMYGYKPEGDLSAGSWKQLRDYTDQFGGSAQITTRTDILAITPTTAVVKLDMEKSPDGSSYTDFHTLMKFEGEWKIIAKVFHAYQS